VVAAVEGWRNNLPEQFTSFVGRAPECEHALGALASARLLALTGAGGSGKTRLALKVAGAAAGSFPDGAWWVELGAATDGGQVAAALTSVLGVRPLPGRTETQAAAEHLATDRALVLLDNCEHVRQEAADLCEELLRGCPRVVVLATSRIPLGVPGESDWQVPSLSLPDGDTLDQVEQSDACRLFSARAAGVSSRFALGDENAAVVAQICRDLDGLPLSIELAAARVRLLTLDQIADGLGDRFRLLSGGPGGALPRHQTLRASVDWSYELLSEAERALFRRLAVFVGGWSLEAIEAVCAGGAVDRAEILDLLAALVDMSLVVVEHHGRVARYRLLEMVRQYALELLEESGEHAALRDRHLAYFVEFAERAAVALNTPLDLKWLELLEPDAANFDAAINHAVETDPEGALRIGVALTAWWEVIARFAIGQSALTRALDAAEPAASALRARALWCCGHLARFRGDAESAARHVQEALELAESIGDEWTLARALFTVGHIQLFRDPTGSRPVLERAVELARKNADDWPLVLGLATLGRTYVVTDELGEATRNFDEVAATVDRTGPEGVIWAMSGEIFCAPLRAEHERCIELNERGVESARALGDPVTESALQSMLAFDETMRGSALQARERQLAIVARVTAAGAGFTFPVTRTELGRALAALGDLEQARQLLTAVVEGGADGGWLLCRALAVLADVLRSVGDADAATARAGETVELAQRIGCGSLAACGREVLARLAIARREWSEGEALAHEVLGARVESEVLVWLPQSLDLLAQIAAGLESYTEAARLLGAAERARADLDLVRWLPDVAAFEQLEGDLAARLGAEAYAAARAEGVAMSMQESIGWARRARGTRKRPAGGWESLTPTEQQVVELVAQGLTNPQVAERMFISRGTVKTHLEHIFRKLDVRSRTELAAIALRRAS
jgi:predicted ATPase/DNA-binding CsgD family transcriptional regulator